MADPVSLLAGALGQNVFDATIRSLSRQLSGWSGSRLRPNTSSLMWDALNRMLTEVSNWSRHPDVSLSEGSTERRIYIELEYFVQPLSDRIGGQTRVIRLKPHLRRMERPLIILGRPGFGKTTTLKAIASGLLAGTSPMVGAFPVPLVIRLREFEEADSITDRILHTLNVGFVDKGGASRRFSDVALEVRQAVAIEIINRHSIVLLLDGFDEVGSGPGKTADDNARQKDKIVKEFQKYVYGCDLPYIFITSRTADFPYRLSGTDTYELTALSDSQVRKFIIAYFPKKEMQEKSLKLILERKLLGAEYIPLTLSYICLLVSHGQEVPATRRDTFERIINLLLSDWDTSRNIRRHSNFPELDLYEKRRFLARLAFDLSMSEHSSFFPEESVRSKFKEISQDYEGIRVSDFRAVFDEIETHTGLFLRSGLGHEFSHKAMQEYLFAQHLVKLPEIPMVDSIVFRFPNELAVAVSSSNDATLYFAYVILKTTLSDYVFAEGIVPFLDRILLEDVSFRVHPYLALSFLTLYSYAASNYHNDQSVFSKIIKQFFHFLNRDLKLDAAAEQLRGAYRVSRDDASHGSFEITKVHRVDMALAPHEPEKLLVPFDLYGSFTMSM